MDKQKVEALRKKAESFVLISNAPESFSTAKHLLEIYKGQVVVELNFKTMKSPILLSNVFLKKEQRIEAMILLVINVALLIRALILYHLRKGYSGTVLKNVTMGLFEYAMESIIMERQDNGMYHINISPKHQLRVMKLLSYLNLDFNDLT